MEDWVKDWLTARAHADADVALLTIVHDMMETLRLARSPLAIVSRGVTFEKAWFECDVLNDDQELPRAQLSIPDVDRRYTDLIRTLIGAPEVTLEVINSANPDAMPVPYRAARLKFRNISRDKIFLTGDLSRGDDNSEDCGTIKMTPARAPAMFRI